MMRPKKKLMSVRLPSFSLACAALLAATLSGVGSPARAGFTTYFGMDAGNGNPPTTLTASAAARTSFIAALTKVGVENFDSMTAGVAPTTPFVFTPLAGQSGTSVSPTTTVNNSPIVSDGTPNGTFATSGPNFLYSSGGKSNGLSVTLDFSSDPISGFGMDITDLNDDDATAKKFDQIQYQMKLSDGTTVTLDTSSYVTSELTHSNVIFFGAISSDPTLLIKSVTITNTLSYYVDGDNSFNDAIGVDDMTIGQVPEPASFCMVALGLGAVLAARRYSRRP